jgi:hypothetical protein
MPGLFAFADKVIGNPQVSLFVAFGSFAMLLLVDFGGALVDRIRAQAFLGIACSVLICLGTLASHSTPVAVVGMAVVGFAVLFIGVVSSVLAGATTTLLLSFILPVMVAGDSAQIPDRIAGWGLASVVSLFAITLLWPAPVVNAVRTRAIDACRALAARLRAEDVWVTSDGGADDESTYTAAVDAASGAVDALHTTFFATPYRPTALATDARAVIRLVDELRWLDRVVLRAAPAPGPPAPRKPVRAVKLAAATALEESASLLEAPRTSRQPLQDARQQLRGALVTRERETTTWPLADGDAAADLRVSQNAISALDPSFRAQELSFVVDQIAANVEFAAAAAQRTWLDRLAGRQPPGFSGPLRSFKERALAHAELSSPWLHNSLRGALALALAVLVADLTSVQHGFWVVFGTLAVLRSNALSTGQNVLRALLGTTAGFVVGGALVALIGTNTALLWALLPIVVLIAGLAPTTISFAAGQAGFTLTLLVLFNLLAPIGWRIGLVRVEDVAIGGGVSLAVGLLFWPRGAAAELGRSLSRAYTDSVHYLAAAVAYGVGRCDASGPSSEVPRDQAVQAAAAARRLDDTFRGYLAERGAKPAPLAEVASLVSGVAGVRLAADAVLDLWNGDGAGGGDRAVARRELLAAADQVTGWYNRFAASLSGSGAVPEAIPSDGLAEGRLVAAVSQDLRDGDGHETATGVRVIWTGDHLDAVRRLEELLVPPAQATLSARERAPAA